MKKLTLVLSSLALFGLVGCGGLAPSSSSSSISSEEKSSSKEESSSEVITSNDPASEDSSSGEEEELVITLYNPDSLLVASSYEEGQTLSMPTYHHKDFGSVPFVNAKDFIEFLDDDEVNAIELRMLSDGLYGVFSNNVLSILFDADSDTIELLRYDRYVSVLGQDNNGVAQDPGSPSIAADALVHPSEKTRFVGNIESEVYDLNTYHMAIEGDENGVYLPAQLLSTISLRSFGSDIVYNGYDYFFSSLSGVNEASFYNSELSFRYQKNYFSPIEETLPGESFRFIASNSATESDNDKYLVFVLSNDGTGAYYSAPAKDSPIPETIDGAKLTWEMDEGGDLYIAVSTYSPQMQTYEWPRTMRLRNEKTYWGSIYREEEIASFNYDLLRFQFDEIYGLKEELNEKIGYTDFDSFVSKMGLKNKFLALDSRLYDEALAEFTMRYVDDGHTTYNARSLYSDSLDVDDASSLANTYIGPRRFTLLSTLKELRELRSEALPGVEPQGLFMEGKTAIIRFDAFLHAMGGYIKRMPDTLKAATPSLLVNASTPFMFLNSFELIKKNPDIENVVLDLTCNGGGMVMAVPFLAAHFSDDPTIVQHDVAMNVVKEYHYKVDLNQNGVYGDEGDTYKGKYNFFLLTSSFSFSCGSLLPAIAHDAGVKLIGEKGGGGACTVGGFADASGSIYNSSSPAQSCYHDKDDKLINNDDGVPVDYPLDRDSWYDLVKLNEFVSNLSN